ACVATDPSDVAVALAALDATVVVRGPAGERAIPFADFHRLPGDTPERDNVLGRGDLIVSIDVPACAEGRASHYLKIRDRQSYEFALVSAAAAVAGDGRRIRSAPRRTPRSFPAPSRTAGRCRSTLPSPKRCRACWRCSPIEACRA